MKARTSMVCGGMGMVCSLAVLAGIFYLTYVFPRTVESWADAGQALSVLQQSMVELGAFCQRFGIILIPLFLLLAAGFGTWLVTGSTRKERGP